MSIIEDLAAKARVSVPEGLVVDEWVAEYNKIFAGLVAKEILTYTSDGDIDFLVYMIKENFGAKESNDD